MKLRSTIFILLIFQSSASAQWVSDIETESDWEQYYLNGYIDYNSYQLLREFAEGADITDTVEFIASTLGISPVELLEKYEVAVPKQSAGKTRKSFSGWSGRLRFGSKIQDERDDSYMLASARSRDTDIYLKLRKDESGKTVTERRSFKIDRGNYSLTLGNFTNDFGCGLGIGRFDYRPVSFEPDMENLDEFLFPDNSYFNGIKAEYLENFALVYSTKKYNDVYKNTLGSVISANLNEIRIGATGLFSRLSSKVGARTFGAGSIFMEMNEHSMRAEVAYGESGFGTAIRIVKQDFSLRGWYYDDAYLNLQSSGFAHPDYQSFTDPYSEISFRQPQRGETGFYAGKKMMVGGFEFQNAAEIWNNPRTGSINYINSIQSIASISRGLRSLVRYTFDEKNGINQNRVESGILISKKYEIDSRVLLDLENGNIINDDSRFHILGTLPLTKSLSMAARFRWYFDGTFDYFIEERAVLNEGLYLKTTYRWKEDSGKKLGSLYAYIENRF